MQAHALQLCPCCPPPNALTPDHMPYALPYPPLGIPFRCGKNECAYFAKTADCSEVVGVSVVAYILWGCASPPPHHYKVPVHQPCPLSNAEGLEGLVLGMQAQASMEKTCICGCTFWILSLTKFDWIIANCESRDCMIKPLSCGASAMAGQQTVPTATKEGMKSGGCGHAGPWAEWGTISIHIATTVYTIGGS